MVLLFLEKVFPMPTFCPLYSMTKTFKGKDLLIFFFDFWYRIITKLCFRCKHKFSSLVVKILTHENPNHENELKLRSKPAATDAQPAFPSDFIESVSISQPRCTYQSTLSGSSILSRIYQMQKLDQVGVEAVAEFYK